MFHIKKKILKKKSIEMVMYTWLCLKTITTRTYCLAHATLLSVIWQPGWQGGLGENDTCTCKAESLIACIWLYPSTK